MKACRPRKPSFVHWRLTVLHDCYIKGRAMYYIKGRGMYYIKGRGMYYPVYRTVHIKYPYMNGPSTYVRHRINVNEMC